MKPPDVYAKSKIKVRNFIVGTSAVKIADLDTARLVIGFHGTSTAIILVSPSRDGVIGGGGIALDNTNPGIVFDNGHHGPLTQCEWYAICPSGGGTLHVIYTNVDCAGGSGGTDLAVGAIPV